MATRPARIIDAHVHLWDPARTDWYPYLGGAMFAGSGDSARMNRRFDAATYRAESAGWNVVGVINVAAATGGHSVDETLAVDAGADAEGLPAAIVGGLPPTDTVEEAIALIDRQAAAPRFRGVRLMGRFPGPLPDRAVLEAVRDRDLVFDLMAHPPALLEAAEGLAAVDGLSVVVEHAGWPRSTEADERRRWEEGMTALAALGDRVVCKISGLAVPLGSLAAADWAPWVEGCLQRFGPDRCLVASNFPVDSVHGTFDELFSTLVQLTAALDDRARDQVFAGTAERVYRL